MATLRVLMFGWEFPPFNAGGLGVACAGLVKALAKKGAKITFVLPKKLDCQSPFCKFIFASQTTGKTLPFLFSPYLSSGHYQAIMQSLEQGFCGSTIFEEVANYAKLAEAIAAQEQYDLIHVHDWLTFPCGLAAKKVSHKPLVVHTHATEFDRTGGHNVNSQVYAIERQGFLEADAVIAVSNFTKEKIVKHYGVSAEKVKVVYNAVEHQEGQLSLSRQLALKDKAKIVLFLGRLTLQKGPDHFLFAAKKVLEVNPNVFFIMAGAGDMEAQLINQAVNLGIAERVIFTGFLRGEDLRAIYQAADLYVLSSVSEPFGITSLEAMEQGTPVLISKQSGSAEILRHCLKVDFWDIEQMANKILAVLKYKELHQELSKQGKQEVAKITWQSSAQKCLEVYNEVLAI